MSSRKFASTALRHLIVITLLYIVCLINAIDGKYFDYNKGTLDWVQTFPDCGGKHQSPIQIDTSKVIKESYQPIKEHGKSRRLKSVDVMNNGRSVQLIAKEDSNKPLITGGPMKNQIFKFEQFHFHWSANDTENCEHQITINNKNKTSPLEMHLVFYNTKYDNFVEATSKPDGLTVLTVLFEVSKTDNPAFEFTGKFDEIAKCGTSISYNFEEKHSLLSNINESYFTYHGSLTTPPCCESVTFILFENFKPISSNQLKKFRELQMGNGKPILKNSRPIQPLNDRSIIHVPAHSKKLKVLLSSSKKLFKNLVNK